MTLFLEALTQAKNSKEAVLEAMVYNSISMVYCGIGDVNNSLEYQLKALEMYRQCSNRHGEATALSNLAIDYGETGDFVPWARMQPCCARDCARTRFSFA